MAVTHSTCSSCNNQFARENPTGPMPKRCPECRPRPRTECPTCAGPLPRSRRSNGSLAPAPKYCSDECKPRCSVDGCDGPARKLGWCANHYTMWKKHGEIREWKYKWATELVCVYCGGPSGVRKGFRKYCSQNCVQFAKIYPEGRPESAVCNGCGESIDLTARGRGGKLKRAGSKSCKRCRRSIHKHSMTVEQLAERDGLNCNICGEEVDLSAVHPDPFRPSIDHFIARANGGTNDHDNLRLTHLWCNQVKSDRENFTI